MEKANSSNGTHRDSFRTASSSSVRCVTYRCGSCGYDLNLSSLNRNTSSIGSKYGKSIKRGIIPFTHVDETRFTLVDGFRCIPFFSKGYWGLFRRQTKLLCRKCGNRIGVAYDDNSPSYSLAHDESETPTAKEFSSHRKYDIKIRSLQPSSSDDSGVPFFT